MAGTEFIDGEGNVRLRGQLKPEPATLPIDASELAAGAAATNVGTLGGVLGGTLPNPTMAANAAAANLLAGAKQEQLNGPTTSVNDGATTDLPLAHVSGDVLLDLSTPAAPKIIAAGIYVVVFSVLCSGLTAGGRFEAILRLLPNVDLRDDGAQAGHVLLSAPIVAGANRPFTVAILNADGVAARDFAIPSAGICKIA